METNSAPQSGPELTQAARSAPGIKQATPIDDLTFTTTPNLLTLLRMAFVPVVVGLLFLHQARWDLAAALAFTAASITDYFDGYIARSRKIVTVYGKLMDPLADKFLVVSSLIMLQQLGRIHPVVVMILICREIAITGLRALASAEGVIIPASGSAKWKTASQMVAIPLIMVKQGLFGVAVYPLGLGLLYVSLGVSLWSAQDYVVDFFKGLKEARKHKATERKQARQARLASRAARIAARAARAAATENPGTPKLDEK